MLNFEMFMILAACSIPIGAILLFILKKCLKSIKKDKTKKQQKVESKIETKEIAESPKEVSPEQVKPEQIKHHTIASEISTDDFRSYLNKRKEISKPKRVELPEDFKDRSMPFMPPRPRNRKPKSMAEEIQALSPELKALILSGALERRDFDN